MGGDRVERPTGDVAPRREAAEHHHELVPDRRVALHGERGDHRRHDITDADVAPAAPLTGEAVHGVATNVGDRIPERAANTCVEASLAT